MKRMFKMMEKKNNDKGELIDGTAWFTRLPQYKKALSMISGRFPVRGSYIHLKCIMNDDLVGSFSKA